MHIGLEHVTLLARERDYVVIPNDNVIQSGVTNYSRPTTTHLCSIYVEAAYQTSAVDFLAALPPIQLEPSSGAAAWNNFFRASRWCGKASRDKNCM
jgi:hypothetical protein